MGSNLCICPCHAKGRTACPDCDGRHAAWVAARAAEARRQLERSRATQYEIIGGPLDGQFSEAPAGAHGFEYQGHTYELVSDDTGARFWRET